MKKLSKTEVETLARKITQMREDALLVNKNKVVEKAANTPLIKKVKKAYIQLQKAEKEYSDLVFGYEKKPRCSLNCYGSLSFEKDCNGNYNWLYIDLCYKALGLLQPENLAYCRGGYYSDIKDEIILAQIETEDMNSLMKYLTELFVPKAIE